jgi:hypothetical protein
LFTKPVLWSDGNQITGDTIHLISNLETEQLDSLKVLSKALMISKDTITNAYFDQIKGRNIYGKFKNNKLDFLQVKGNAESVYFNKNEDTKEIETVTKEVSSTIEFTLDKGQIISIKYLKDTDGITYPLSKLPEQVRFLKGFIWREDEQPKSKEAIFIKDNAKPKTKNDFLKSEQLKASKQ